MRSNFLKAFAILFIAACSPVAASSAAVYTVINTNPAINNQPGHRPMALTTFTDQRMTSLRCAMMEKSGTTYLCGADGLNTFFCARTGGVNNPNYYTQQLNPARTDLLGIYETGNPNRNSGGTHILTMDVPVDGRTHITAAYAVQGKTSTCDIGSGGLSATYRVTTL